MAYERVSAAVRWLKHAPGCGLNVQHFCCDIGSLAGVRTHVALETLPYACLDSFPMEVDVAAIA